MRKNIIFISILFFASCASLKKLPQEHYYEFLYNFNREFKNDTISFHLKNPLKCPVNIKLGKDSLNPNIEYLFGNITLTELQDTIIRFEYPDFNQTNRTKYIVRYGDLNKKIEKNEVAYPFPKGKEYKIIQAYNGKFTHNTLYSQYAIDFDLKIGDTITSVDSGYIVGVIEDYKDYGTSKKWLENDKSNYITIYHPHSGIYTQYVHLDHKGSLVTLGDFVEKGQVIGICGMTGFTTTPHLHFNAKIPTEENGLISTKIEFESGVKGEDLKKKDRVK
ncbi:M23 family metallopeptidase [Olivibacter sitiensis]|uniref:M23 family metallopeptidase n=1 Tax=Olivibacter sitiensis TaxID=376470 RepID=UPI0003F83CF8|nr:M23 family metallopeptidase [Olivibacter sitiensis]